MFKIYTLFFAIFLSGCVETVVVGTVATGAYIISDGTIFDTNQDSRIESAIKKTFKQDENKENLKNIEVNVFDERVLLTGYIRNKSEYKTLAVNITRSIKPNIEVIDDIILIGNNYNIGSFSDSLISKQISMKLKATGGIKSNNYKYDVVDGVVFIIGSSTNKEELEKTTNMISQIKGVKKVISYIKINN